VRVPYTWLLEFIELTAPLEEVAERLSLCALEVDSIERPAAALDGVIVGRLLEVEKHPNADKLTVCQVDLGTDTPQTIVCGARNHREGDYVAVATPNTKLPNGLTIKRSKIRDVVSDGMLCSLSELGFEGEYDGILILQGEPVLGSPVARALGLEEAILEIDILPDRGDCASVLGIAREFGALYALEVRSPNCEVQEEGPAANGEVTVRNLAPERCHDYLARLVRGVKVGPSPDWLIRRLESLGLRSINNVVDVTNFVLMELGQPLHAFDAATLPGKEIVVRLAHEGETIALLDDQEVKLSPDDLVIADRQRAVALAGVMGGAATAVSDTTTDVILEAARFEPRGIRRTVRRHGLRSDSSYRFERGVDPDGVRRAIDRAARLLNEVAGGKVAPGVIEARGDRASQSTVCVLHAKRVERILGMSYSEDEITQCLERVGVRVAREEDGLHCQPPSWRLDLSEECDYIEEIVRLDGYAPVPETMPLCALRTAQLPQVLRQRAVIREALRERGYREAVNLAFVSEKELIQLRFDERDAERAAVVALANPLGEEMAYMRTSLLPALLRGAARNVRRGVRGLRQFELAKVFFAKGKGTLPDERHRLAAVIIPTPVPKFWKISGEDAGFFQAKQDLLASLAAQRRSASVLPRTDGIAPYYHPAAVGSVQVGERGVGVIGRLHPEVAHSYDLPEDTVVFELDLDAVSDCDEEIRSYREAPRYQAVVRDLALLVDQDVSAARVAREIRAAASKQLEDLELFDQYVGEGIPTGRKSLAFRLTLRSRERTLEDKDVTKTIDRVLARLERELRAEQR